MEDLDHMEISSASHRLVVTTISRQVSIVVDRLEIVIMVRAMGSEEAMVIRVAGENHQIGSLLISTTISCVYPSD